MQANLIFLSKNGKQKVIPLPSNVTTLGRRHNCDLHIPLESVSKQHCQITCENPGTFKLKDLGSTNGTFLNGKRVKEEAIKAGDYIKVGPLLFAIQINGQPQNITLPSPPTPKQQDLSGDTLAQEGLEDSVVDLDASGTLGEFNDMDATLDDLDDL